MNIQQFLGINALMNPKDWISIEDVRIWLYGENTLRANHAVVIQGYALDRLNVPRMAHESLMWSGGIVVKDEVQL